MANKTIHTLTCTHTHTHTHTHKWNHATKGKQAGMLGSQLKKAIYRAQDIWSWSWSYLDLGSVIISAGTLFRSTLSQFQRWVGLIYVKFSIVLCKELPLAVLHVAFLCCCRSTNWPFGSATSATCITLVRSMWKRSLMWISSARPSSLLALRLTMLDWRYRPCFELRFLCHYILSHH